ncbi:MAG: 4Fe-4S dicluster domain-containing protein [Dethiobacter sp.]|nr:4Fe-4S dicluster domain-containing protein [Dethiobacter sp.]
MANRSTEYIQSIQAKCRDCYLCLRSCPVKAIRLEPGKGRHELHASVIDQRCILDGRCVKVCPQKAKRPRLDTDRVRAMLAAGVPLAASIAPSFPSLLSADTLLVPAILRKLGFAYVQETAVGAEMVAREHQRLARESGHTLITSSCPAVVNLFQCHFPAAMHFLAPIVSPMIAHGRYLKGILPDHKVVFIGPCIAKKHEAETSALSGAIDAVLTFEELLDWFEQEKIDLDRLEPGGFDGITPNLAKLFAVDGGALRTAALDTDVLSQHTQTVSGLERCKALIEHVLVKPDELPRLIEMVACEGGCIAGPTNPAEDHAFRRRQRVLRYAEARNQQMTLSISESAARAQLNAVELSRSYEDQSIDLPEPDEDTVRAILAKAGRHKPEHEINCGSCGYDTCREKAVAVFRGWAAPEMCIPYMRERAESMYNTIGFSTPNAVFVVNPEGIIIDINPAAERVFRIVKADALDHHISQFMSSEIFERVAETGELLRDEVSFPLLDYSARRTVYWEDSQRLTIAVLADCTAEKRHLETVQQLRSQTLNRAQDVINKQMAVAQKIAGLLGETTAETKVILTQLMKIMRDESGETK